jgi:hypothetical protein
MQIKRLHEILELPEERLAQLGVFDAFVGIDSRLHIDPHLLQASSTPEMRAAYARFTAYWEDTLRILKRIKDDGDPLHAQAVSRFRFREVPAISLGYSKQGSHGSGVGILLARALKKTAQRIVEVGVDDPKLFELFGVFQEDVGPDLISDITISITLQDFLQFTARIAAEVGIRTRRYTFHNASYELPSNPTNGQPLVLLPRDVLRELPTALDWDDIDSVCKYASEIRAKVNSLIGATWKRATRALKKKELLEILLHNPDALKDMIQQYREKPTEAYDFVRDILGEELWLPIAQQFTQQNTLDLSKFSPVTAQKLPVVMKTIAEHFKRLVENNGLWRFFYVDDEIRHERFPQLLFFAIADTYCRSNDLDLSPEANSGRGPVDFKLSRGYAQRFLVEVKYSKNTKLKHGYLTQLGEYQKAEQTTQSILLVLKVTRSSQALEEILQLRDGKIRLNEPCPDIVVVDALPKDSASHHEP